MVTPYRKDPDQLLEALAREESRQARGKLRIYFGASAGVGKTFSMLTAAHQELAAGHDVVIGVIETHDREDTRQLALSVPAIPLDIIHYRDRVIRELDLDAMLTRRRRLRSSMNWPIPMRRDCDIANAGRILMNCWAQGSMSGPR
ncbi:osmosensitive K channel His kinase sensor [Advenella kashmirensis WT001]|uniref:Osmosensitive K channel His kinase sensor n=1 Tax=Advenella kashmirensis (strain DSM 17095 / LMG 22695 / WT001) TaxID=1036672 RepID=I3UFD3_ADVKW|nr:osmosensitive K channel His kinase sensor [Advenella kashmirensis]AFK63721.1 osmosensitive K channel His kinase sensor [Advenella kashmirensis WT001]